MQTDEFTRRVQERANISTGDAALKVIEATLETLGERLERDERGDLAAELPDQLKTYVQKRKEALPSPCGLEEFYNRVAARSELGLPAAIQQAHTVIAVLGEAVSGGQLEDIRQQLPNEYKDLFAGRSSGPDSPAAEEAD